MRKNNDGYVIIYVIFVILFLCVVAIGTCSSALSNLQSQNKAVVQMQERYAAEGEIEKQVAELCAGLNDLKSQDEDTPKPLDTSTNGIRSTAIADIKDFLGTVVEPTKISETENIYTYVCEMSGTKNNHTVKANVEFRFIIAFSPEETIYVDNDNQIINYDKYIQGVHPAPIVLYSYRVSNTTAKYTSYTIENAGGDAA